MKKFFLNTFVLCFLSLLSYAQPSSLTVFSEDGDKFWVILNGEKQNALPLTKVVVANQTEPFQKMRIIFEDEKIPTLNQSIQFIDYEKNWNDISYGIKQKSKGKYVLRVASWKPSASASNSQVILSEDKMNSDESAPVKPATKNIPDVKTSSTSSTTSMSSSSNSVGTNVQMADPSTGINFSMNVSMPNMEGMNATTTTTTQHTSSAVQTNIPVEPKEAANPSTNDPSRCSSAMSVMDFADAKKSISSKGFEDTKLQVAKQVAKNNCLNTSQVKEIIALFGFENTKLNFAKLAYERTIYKKNYYKVGDSFGFSSSVDELNLYIDSK